MSLYTWALKYVVPMRETVFRTYVEGQENLPTDGAAILCCSHRSNFDPVVVGLAVPRPLRFMAKAELFRIPLFRSLIRALGAFPIHRGIGDRQALQRAENLLREGELLLIFPEGTRLRSGRVPGRFQSGAVRLALRAGVPIVPAAILNEGKTRLFRRKTVRFGEPVTASALGVTEAAHDAERLRAANALLRGRVMALLGVSDHPAT